jgi:hypothetical protein
LPFSFYLLSWLQAFRAEKLSEMLWPCIFQSFAARRVALLSRLFIFFFAALPVFSKPFVKMN